MPWGDWQATVSGSTSKVHPKRALRAGKPGHLICLSQSKALEHKVFGLVDLQGKYECHNDEREYSCYLTCRPSCSPAIRDQLQCFLGRQLSHAFGCCAAQNLPYQPQKLMVSAGTSKMLYPQRSKYPIFEVLGSNKTHTPVNIWDERPQILGTCKLWVSQRGASGRALRSPKDPSTDCQGSGFLYPIGSR